jgi:hypothetical protein
MPTTNTTVGSGHSFCLGCLEHGVVLLDYDCPDGSHVERTIEIEGAARRMKRARA